MARKILAILPLALLAVTGCTTGPNYQAPSPAMPEQWASPLSGGEEASAGDLSTWWKSFQDPELETLITEALAANQDLRVAAARLREARAVRGITAADLYPGVNVSDTYTRSRTKDSFEIGSGGLLAGTTPDRNRDLFEGGFDAHWELDLFGGNRRAVEAADADIGAAEAGLNDARVSLAAEVARNYLELRGTQGRLIVTRKNAKAQTDTVDITRSRYDAGLATELDIKQAQGQLSATASTLPTLEAAAMASIYRLGVLTGQQPGALLARLASESPLPQNPPVVPVGLPSEVLRRRPDIQRSERELAASTARIGVAMADLFPKFSLTGSFGSSSTDIKGFDLGASRFWSIGPAIQFPLFDAGRIRSNIEVQNARQEAALAQYEKSVLVALEDTEKALTAYSKEQQRLAILEETRRVAQEAVDIATEMYTKGLSDFLDVLQTQDALYDAEDRKVQSEQFVLQQLVAVYKALGGGWDAPKE